LAILAFLFTRASELKKLVVDVVAEIRHGERVKEKGESWSQENKDNLKL
jgi:hypothetical protein